MIAHGRNTEPVVPAVGQFLPSLAANQNQPEDNPVNYQQVKQSRSASEPPVQHYQQSL